MALSGVIFIITLTLQSYILNDKTHIEKIKVYRYALNIIILLVTSTLFYITADMPEKYYRINGNYFAIALFAFDILSIIEWYYIKKNRLDDLLIKITIDKSDSGIMTVSNDNRIMFQNSRMYSLLNALGIHKDYSNSIKNKAVRKIGKDYIVEQEDKAILFRFSNNEDEITAYDISEEYNLQNKLKKQNETIKQNNEKLIWTIEHLDDLEREEKSLKIKNKFHDILRTKFIYFTSILKPRGQR